MEVRVEEAKASFELDTEQWYRDINQGSKRKERGSNCTCKGRSFTNNFLVGERSVAIREVADCLTNGY